MAHTIDLDAYHLVDCFVAYKRSFLQDLGELEKRIQPRILYRIPRELSFIPRLGQDADGYASGQLLKKAQDMSHNSIIKKIIVKLHLYTGLILGLVITLICLCPGTAIVYKPELEKLSVKDIAFVKPASPNRAAANFVRERKMRISTS